MRATGCIVVCLAALLPMGAHAQPDGGDLAKQVANPISSLISVPFQSNFDCCYGPEDSFRHLLNFQPVIPVTLSEDLTLVTRTIIPTIYLEAPAATLSDEFGLGDTLQSFFLVPPTVNGMTVGAGPAIQWPTATDSALGTQEFGGGRTAVALWQGSGWTIGALANHVWTFDGDSSQTYLQPFLSYTWPSTVSVTLNTESTYDWAADQWTVPINLQVSRIVKLGEQPASIGGGVVIMSSAQAAVRSGACVPS
jgi:hypothetical protein